ncbi:MAG: hypothetical protein ACK55Z_15135, partial [bacterium]
MRTTSRSIVTTSVRLLSAITRPAESKILPRSGKSLIVRVRTLTMTSSTFREPTACKNHIRVESAPNNTSATTPR